VEPTLGSRAPGNGAGAKAPEGPAPVAVRARTNGDIGVELRSLRASELQVEPETEGQPRRGPSRAEGRIAQPVAFILAEDPELGEGLPPQVRRTATEMLRARVIVVNRPRWQPPELDPRTTYGLLVLDGLIGRRIRVGRAVSTELLSAGDILRPWEEPCLWNLIPPEVDWRVFRPTRVAILDERITKLICARPELAIAFAGRLYRRVRHAEYIMAISHLPKVEHKLLATLWHLASNWGRVTPEGVYIPFRLTHEVLGEILGAKRPSVTTAMTQLQRRGEIAIGAGGGYLLKGNPADWDRVQ
jgi:CRP/FNR family transcriptional regulator, cyclic AMP receptor protein